jgi:error-prone DNA polymerase
MSFLRGAFTDERVLSCAGVGETPDGRRVKTAGVVLIRQRPGKGNAIFMTLEDETGIVNVVIWARMIETYRKAIVGSRLILVEGKVQRSVQGVIHLMAERLEDRTAWLQRLSDGTPVKPDLSRADEFANPAPPRHPRNLRILPKSRDFH